MTTDPDPPPTAKSSPHTLRALLRPGGRARIAIQIGGFAAGLAILVWCILLAFRPENREKLSALAEAPARLVALLGGLCVLSVLLNGAAFWTTLLPVRRLGFVDVQAVNGIASFLSYLPFKLSVVARFVIHNRRDGVPVLTIGAWMAALGAAVAASLVPPIAAGVWRKQVDTVFVLCVAGGMAVMYAVTLAAARGFAREIGMRRLHRLLDPLHIGFISRMLRSHSFHHLHDGFAMLAHPGSLAATMSLRCIDLLIQAARFLVAAKIVGADLSWEGAILAASTYFVIVVISPAGGLGTKEGGATGLAALLAIPGFSEEGFVVIALTVSGAELIVHAGSALLGLVWLRVHRPAKLTAENAERAESS